MTVELDCPWCSEPMCVTRDELDAEMRCGECGVRFELAPDVTELAVAA